SYCALVTPSQRMFITIAITHLRASCVPSLTFGTGRRRGSRELLALSAGGSQVLASLSDAGSHARFSDRAPHARVVRGLLADSPINLQNAVVVAEHVVGNGTR